MLENSCNRTFIIDYIKNKFDTASVNGITINSVTSFDKEYLSLKESVAIRILSGNSIIKFSGKDTLDFLHRVSTNDLKTLEEFHKKNTLFTNEKGRVIDRATLIKFNDYLLLLGGKGTQGLLSRWIEKYIIMEDIKISDVRNEFTVLEIQGPQAESYLTQICGKCIDDLKNDQVKNFEMNELSASIFKQVDKNNLVKYFIILKNEEFQQTLDYLLSQNNIFDVNLVGEIAYNHLRIEMGVAESPNEINDNFNPYEINLIDEVNFKKGCYIGQEVIARLETYDKVQKKMCRVKLNQLVSSSEELVLYNEENKEVGFITSLSPNQHKTIGLAIVRKAFVAENIILNTIIDNNNVEVTVSEIK